MNEPPSPPPITAPFLSYGDYFLPLKDFHIPSVSGSQGSVCNHPFGLSLNRFADPSPASDSQALAPTCFPSHHLWPFLKGPHTCWDFTWPLPCCPPSTQCPVSLPVAHLVATCSSPGDPTSFLMSFQPHPSNPLPPLGPWDLPNEPAWSHQCPA